MDNITEILNAEKAAGEIKRKASEAAADIINAAEAYRADSMNKARAEGDIKSKKLTELACEEARRQASELTAKSDGDISRIRAVAASNLEKAAEYISERLMSGK